MDRDHILNFGAGPSALPTDVLHDAARGLLNYEDSGIGIAELSHRSPPFLALNARLEALIRARLHVPDSHLILFTQGGGTAQFSAVVLNLFARHRLRNPHGPPPVADYVLTGSWSLKALAEAQRLAGPDHAHVVVDARAHSPAAAFDNIPDPAAWRFSPAPAYVYYCENETVDGVQFAQLPDSAGGFPLALLPPDTPLVADVSSSFLSRHIPHLAAHALLFAGAQKNLGPAGLTVLLVRRDLLVEAAAVPRVLEYKTLADARSLYNTPPAFAMYVAALVLARAAPPPVLEATNWRKQLAVYDALERAGGKVRVRVSAPARSWMNVVFDVCGGDGTGAEEKRFLAEAEARGFRQLKGHRSVGGIRVSLYNAITEEQVARLVAFIDEFFAAGPRQA